jgi:hypothetical protein
LRLLLSILLVALFGFLSIGPAFSASGDGKVPACCRRAGKHRCAVAAVGAGQTIAAGRCVNFPDSFVSTGNSDGFIAGSVRAVFASHDEPRNVILPDPAGRAGLLSRSHLKRGPPSLLDSLI